MLDKRSFYINGSWVEPQITNDFNVIDPSTEEPCAFISLGSEADTNKAVDAARSAFEGWMFTPKNDRLKLIENILEEINLFCIEVRESPASLNIPSPTPEPDRGGPTTCLGDASTPFVYPPFRNVESPSC